MFEDKVFEKIKDEIEPDNLYMGLVYEAASCIIPINYTIIDLGCYMAPQAFLFEDHVAYIGVDCMELITEGYTAPPRFEAKNSRHVTVTIEDFVRDYPTSEWVNNDKVYVISNAVPATTQKEIKDALMRTFKDIAIYYPGEEDIFLGIEAKRIEWLTQVLEKARCPYNGAYLRKNPDIRKIYEKRQQRIMSACKFAKCVA